MKKTSILAFLLFFTNLSTTLARHLVGGTMSYKLVEKGTTSNRFAFTMTIYRDCSATASPISAPFDEIASIGVYDGNKRLVFNLRAQLGNIRAMGVCINGYCVEIGTYQWTVELPVFITNYTFLYQRCCRAENFNNLLNPSATGMTVALELSPAAQTLSNSSPVFKNNLPLLFCVNQNVNLNFSATDVDNDTLKYEFYNVFSGGGQIGGNGCNNTSPSPPCLDGMQPATYLNSRFDKPLGTGIFINEKTGILSGTIEVVGFFALGVKISEYRNNVLLSQSYLDYSLYSFPCPNQGSICSTTAVKDINHLSIKAYPNPSQGFIYLESDMDTPYCVEIVNNLGQLLSKKNVQDKSNNLDISDLPNGIYFLKVQDQKVFEVIKVVKN